MRTLFEGRNLNAVCNLFFGRFDRDEGGGRSIPNRWIPVSGRSRGDLVQRAVHSKKMEEYTFIRRRGEGTFAEVWEVEHKKSRQKAALKILKRKFSRADDVCNEVEFQVLRLFSSRQRCLRSPVFDPHITGLYDAFFDMTTGQVFYVLELLGPSLLDEMLRRRLTPRPLLFSENELRVILHQLLSAIAKMHARGIFHRDIKPENVLLLGDVGASSPSLRLKLADFGSSQFIRQLGSKAAKDNPLLKKKDTRVNNGFTREGASFAREGAGFTREGASTREAAYTEYIATRWYRSPECLLTTGHYGPPMDLWATGCVAIELLTGQPVFPGDTELHQLQLIHLLFGQTCLCVSVRADVSVRGLFVPKFYIVGLHCV